MTYQKLIKVLSHHGIFLIYIDFNKFKTNKKSLMNYLLKKGLKVQFHYIPINEFKVFSIPKKLFKGAKKYKDSTLSIPIYVGLKKTNQIKVVRLINNFLQKNLIRK